jgi:hypothetical protein
MELIDIVELDEHDDNNPECAYNNPRSRTVSNPPPSQNPDKPPTPGPSNSGDFDDALQLQNTSKRREVEQVQEPDNEEPENRDNGRGN